MTSGCALFCISVMMYSIVAHEYKPIFFAMRFLNTLAISGASSATRYSLSTMDARTSVVWSSSGGRDARVGFARICSKKFFTIISMTDEDAMPGVKK